MTSRLRSEITVTKTVDRNAEEVLLALDSSTRRFFTLPIESEDVVNGLNNGASFEQICAELDGSLEPEEIQRFIGKLRALHLLDEGTGSTSLREQIVSEHRARNWRQLVDALEYAATKIPVYRERYAAAGVVPASFRDHSDLHRVPYFTKADIRANYPTGLLPDGMSLDHLMATNQIHISASSGSSAGDRLQMLSTLEARGSEMVAGSMLNLDLFKVMRGQQSVLTSMHCADPNFCVREEPSMKKRIRQGNRLLLIPPEDPGAPTLAELKQMVEELRAHQPQWLDCNPTYLACVSWALRDADIRPPSVPVITCGFEYLTKIHRKLISEVWGCKVFNRYTASEIGTFQIIECEHGGMHVNDSHYYPEIVRDGRHVKPGEAGRLLQTTVKETIPLIRYDTEDVVVAGDQEECACGGISSRVGAIAGRARDIVSARDGSPRMTRDIDNAISSVEGVRFYQFFQKDARHYAVKVVCDPSADEAAVKRSVAEASSFVVGPGAEVRVDTARRIYPEASGKFRICRSELPDTDKLITAYA